MKLKLWSADSRDRGISARFLLVLAIAVFSGCACPRGANRPFQLSEDSFAFANELRWIYEFDSDNHVTTRETDPPPEYSLRCFPMVRAAREFFYHAEFRPELPKVSEPEYRELISAVMRRNSRCPAAETKRIAIPGYSNLHEFSTDHAALLQSECGGAIRSFFQRGNWRMVFPITHSGQQKTAERFVAEIKRGQLPIAHVYRFPNTTLNHALFLYAADESGSSIQFSAYDPNDPGHPTEVRFDRAARVFLLKRNGYFQGGAVRVYEVYRGAFF